MTGQKLFKRGNVCLKFYLSLPTKIQSKRDNVAG